MRFPMENRKALSLSALAVLRQRLLHVRLSSQFQEQAMIPGNGPMVWLELLYLKIFT